MLSFYCFPKWQFCITSLHDIPCKMALLLAIVDHEAFVAGGAGLDVQLIGRHDGLASRNAARVNLQRHAGVRGDLGGGHWSALMLPFCLEIWGHTLCRGRVHYTVGHTQQHCVPGVALST